MPSFILCQADVLEGATTLAKWAGMPVAILCVWIYSIHRGWCVPGRIYTDALKRNADLVRELKVWQEHYIELLNNSNASTHRAVTVMEKMLDVYTSPPTQRS